MNEREKYVYFRSECGKTTQSVDGLSKTKGGSLFAMLNTRRAIGLVAARTTCVNVAARLSMYISMPVCMHAS